MAKKKYQLYLDAEHFEVLEEIIALKELDKFDTVSQVVRFIVLDYYKLLTTKKSPDVRLNKISKELSMTLNLVASLVNKVDAEQVRNEDVLQYHQSKKYVNGDVDQDEQERLKKRNDELARFLDSI